MLRVEADGLVFSGDNLDEMKLYVSDCDLMLNYTDDKPSFTVKCFDGFGTVNIGDKVIRSYHKGKRVFKVEKGGKQ